MVKGIILSLISSFGFAGLYYMSVLLAPLGGSQLLGYRMLMTFPIIAVFALSRSRLSSVHALLARLCAHPHLIIVLMLTAALNGSQMWLYLWAPSNGAALKVSIGYLIMPISMMFFGALVFKERVTPLKSVCVMLACLGVASKVIISGALSWESALVFIGFPLYFCVRRYFKLDGVATFACEIALLVPVSLFFIKDTNISQIATQNHTSTIC